MAQSLERRFYLNAVEIDNCSEQVYDYLTQRNIPRKEALRIRLSVEEVLLTWLEKLGAGTEIKLLCSRRLGKESVRLQCRGAECNPFTADKGDLGDWVNALRSSLEFLPLYRYADTYNRVIFNVRVKTLSRLLVTVLAIAAGIALGLLGALLPHELRQTVCENIFTPVYNAYLAAFSLCGVPVIFTSVVTGILGADDITAFSANGRRMIGRFLLLTALAAAGAILVALPFFRLNFGAEGFVFQYGELLQMLLDWVPTGLLQPFVDSNAMQLILLGGAFGICLLLLNLGGGSLVGLLNDLHRVLQQIIGWLSRLIPLFVFLMIVNSIWTSESAVLLSAWKSWVVTTGMEALIVAVLLVYVAVKYRARVTDLLKKLGRTFITALGTNTCVASIGDNYDCCGNKLGIDPRVYSFGIPIGTTIFKPATAARLVILCFFMAEARGMGVSLWWVVTLWVMAVAFSIAIPAIPGGVIIFCPMLFSQMGLPTELVTQMLATDVFFDCFCTAFNQIAVPLALVPHADSLGLLTREMISRPAEELTSPYDFQLEKKLRDEAPEYHRVFRENVKTCQDTLTRYRSLFPYYTDHSSLHSLQLINFCNQMVGKNIDRLNRDEIFVLLMAAYLHDVGMGISPEDFEEFSQKLPFAAAYRAAHPEEPDAEVVRRFHNEFSGCYIEKYAATLQLPDPGHLHAIVQTSRGHRKVNLRDEAEFPAEYRLENGSVVHLAYLAALIRLADELDIAADRNFDFMYNLEDIRNPDSRLAYRSHIAIRRMETKEDHFVFHVTRPGDAELQATLDTTFTKLRETLADCVDIIETKTDFIIRQKYIEAVYEDEPARKTRS